MHAAQSACLVALHQNRAAGLECTVWSANRVSLRITLALCSHTMHVGLSNAALRRCTAWHSRFWIGSGSP